MKKKRRFASPIHPFRFQSETETETGHSHTNRNRNFSTKKFRGPAAKQPDPET